MTGCQETCPYEQTSMDARSYGAVNDNERVVRASYDPMHYKGDKLKASFVRNDDLLNGQLSVWRLHGSHGTESATVREILTASGPSGHALRGFHSASVSQIRAVKGSDGSRLFCVVDEVETGDDGGFHPAHAHIRLCDSVRAQIEHVGDAKFVEAKEQLVLLLRQPAQ